MKMMPDRIASITPIHKREEWKRIKPSNPKKTVMMDRQETLKASVVRKAGENWIINSSFWKRLLPLSIESPFPLKVSTMVPFRPSLKYSSTDALLMLIREVAMLISWLKEIFLSVSKRQSCKKMNQFKFSCSAKFIFRNQTHESFVKYFVHVKNTYVKKYPGYFALKKQKKKINCYNKRTE